MIDELPSTDNTNKNILETINMSQENDVESNTSRFFHQNLYENDIHIFDLIVNSYNTKNSQKMLVNLHKFNQISLNINFPYFVKFRESGLSKILLELINNECNINTLSLILKIITNLTSYPEEDRYIHDLINNSMFTILLHLIETRHTENIISDIFRIFSNCCLTNIEIRDVFLNSIPINILTDCKMIDIAGMKKVLKLLRAIIHFQISEDILNIIIDFLSSSCVSGDINNGINSQILYPLIDFVYEMKKNYSFNHKMLDSNIINGLISSFPHVKDYKKTTVLLEIFVPMIKIIPERFLGLIPTLLNNLNSKYSEVSLGSAIAIRLLLIDNINLFNTDDLQNFIASFINIFPKTKNKAQIILCGIICEITMNLPKEFTHQVAHSLLEIYNDMIDLDSSYLSRNILNSIVDIQMKEDQCENGEEILQLFISENMSTITSFLYSDDEKLSEITELFLSVFSERNEKD
ncbi:hypothetical protein TRFO_29417 [Tritrichomonas foetus]|uniref:Uncharacterized protein n=1 Tax=Tritrichomonas foetus TaxID=1144522 RepID=A0A1J4JXQ2_9EUKA|nr:hypothetical protein TRFO_29417 [Tritrichomonas foetus]|eukprot:OHT03232.1 hypothetical protein TRFO_29417 [Tritrichomonas foetus]